MAQRGEPKELSDIVKRPGRCREEKRKKSDHGRIAFIEHGGKTGRAMVKYPLYKKNAQPYKRSVYPGLGSVSLDR